MLSINETFISLIDCVLLFLKVWMLYLLLLSMNTFIITLNSVSFIKKPNPQRLTSLSKVTQGEILMFSSEASFIILPLCFNDLRTEISVLLLLLYLQLFYNK